MAVPADTAQEHLVGGAAGRGTNGDDLSRAITTTFFGVFQRMRQHSTRRAADYDLSVTHVRALYELREPLSMRELAERLYLDPSNLTALVDRLEDLDLVERTSDAGDRRVKRLVLTARGAELSGEIIDAVFTESPVFKVLDPGEQRRLLDLLTRVAESPEP
jgi:MarR family transcriptional regulator, organic hydroperoxide resistance regulator